MNPLDDPRIRLSRLARELASRMSPNAKRVVRSMSDMDLRGPTGKGIAERMAESAAGEIEDLQAEFRAKRDEITAEITTLTAKAEALRSENTAPSIPTMEWFNGLTTMWSGADTGMVNEALRSTVKRIYVHRADVQRDDLIGRLHVIGLWANDPHLGDLRLL